MPAIDTWSLYRAHDGPYGSRVRPAGKVCWRHNKTAMRVPSRYTSYTSTVAVVVTQRHNWRQHLTYLCPWCVEMLPRWWSDNDERKD